MMTLIQSRMRRGNAFGRVCLFVSVCAVRARTVESIDIESSCLICRYIFRISRSVRMSRLSGQGQCHAGAKTGICVRNQIHICVDSPSIKKHSCLGILLRFRILFLCFIPSLSVCLDGGFVLMLAINFHTR